MIAGQLLALASLAILIVVPILVIRGRRRMLGVPSAPLSLQPIKGKVRFVFHRYSGFLIFVRQTRYDSVLSVEEAAALLKELVRHNLTWGLLAYGGIFVPIFTFFEWRAQSKRIAMARAGR